MAEKEKNTPDLLPGGITKDQLAAFQAKHGEGKINVITIKDGEGKEHTAYLKRADRNVVSQALSMMSANKPLEAGEVILNNCWLAGDEAIKTDDNLFIAAATEARATVELYTSSLKKV